MLIVESAFADEDVELSRKAFHYCPQLLAADLDKLNHRPELYITHMKPGSEDHEFLISAGSTSAVWA